MRRQSFLFLPLFVFLCRVFLAITKKGDLSRFREVWEGCVADAASRPRFKVVAVSFPDLGPDTGLAVAAMGAVMDGNGAGGDGERGAVSVGSTATAGKRGGEGGGENDIDDAVATAAGGDGDAAHEVPAAGRALNVWQVRSMGKVTPLSPVY